MPRGRLVALGGAGLARDVWRAQAGAARSAGNRVTFAPTSDALAAAREAARAFGRGAVDVLDPGADWTALRDLAGALAGDPAIAAEANRRLAARAGARLPVIEPTGEPPAYPRSRLSIERTLSVNTTASGGNASLVAAMD